LIEISSFEGAQLNRCFLPPPPPEDGNRSSFRNVVFLLPKHRTMENVQEPSKSVCYTPKSEPYEIYVPFVSYADLGMTNSIIHMLQEVSFVVKTARTALPKYRALHGSFQKQNFSRLSVEISIKCMHTHKSHIGSVLKDVSTRRNVFVVRNRTMKHDVMLTSCVRKVTSTGTTI
jgi:hypothetical protein